MTIKELEIRKHPRINESLSALPDSLIESFELLGHRLKHKLELSDFVKTEPLSSDDAVGRRTRLEHYHLRPCNPVCYLVWVVRTVDAAYILEVSKHPESGKFVDSEIEGRLYSLLVEVCPEFSEYQLPGTHRSGFPVHNSDRFNPRTVNGNPGIAPVRTPESNYLPIGQLSRLSGGKNRIGIVVGTFEIASEDIPEEAMECIDDAGHPERESLTLYSAGWIFRAGLYQKATEHIVLIMCSLHSVIIRASSMEGTRIVASGERAFKRLVDSLKDEFPPVYDREQELGKMVDLLVKHFPLYRA